MKITVYTTTDCQFSKQELEYLKSHSLQYDEKNLETNRDYLTEMLTVSNNFAGTPVTKIEKDDGQIAVLKGFTASEFDEALGFAKPAMNTQQGGTDEPAQPPTPQPTTPEPATPTPPPAPTEQPMTPPAINTPAGDTTPTTTDPKMNELLNSLQQKVNTMPQAPDPTPPMPPEPTTPVAPPGASEAPQAPAPGTPTPVAAMPTIPDPQL